jgi:hypothetical protein
MGRGCIAEPTTFTGQIDRSGNESHHIHSCFEHPVLTAPLRALCRFDLDRPGGDRADVPDAWDLDFNDLLT